MKKKEKHSYP